jgi:hypothetical protein
MKVLQESEQKKPWVVIHGSYLAVKAIPPGTKALGYFSKPAQQA